MAWKLCGESPVECYPICDYCQYFLYDDADKGECRHPDHPSLRWADEVCDDFWCFNRGDADPELVKSHLAAAAGKRRRAT